MSILIRKYRAVRVLDDAATREKEIKILRTNLPDFEFEAPEDWYPHHLFPNDPIAYPITAKKKDGSELSDEELKKLQSEADIILY